MPITLLRRGHEGPPLSTEITATGGIGQARRKRYSVVNISACTFRSRLRTDGYQNF